MSDPMGIGAATHSKAEQVFREALEAMRDEPEDGYSPRILELGTKRSDPEFPTHHREWLPDGRWTMADIAPGTDVDVTCNAHDIVGTWHPLHADQPRTLQQFDAAIAVSVWEHLERPWVAAAALAEVVHPDGWVYIATHQTFPIHGYPSDFFRFSREALALIFDDAGFEVMDTGYAFPAQIVPPVEVSRWNPAAPAFLNVDLAARKP